MYSQRTDFERALNLIREKKINGVRDSRIIETLEKQRYLPNGRINLTLVDEGLRATMHLFASNAFDNMKNLREKDDA